MIGFTERTPEQTEAKVRAISDDELIAYTIANSERWFFLQG